jgi:hypothetical protein
LDYAPLVLDIDSPSHPFDASFSGIAHCGTPVEVGLAFAMTLEHEYISASK